MAPSSLGRRVTIHDVAARAGVSPAHRVARPLEPPPRACRRAYPAARVVGCGQAGLSPQRDCPIARSSPVVRPGGDVCRPAQPVHGEVITGAERVAADAGYAMLLCDQQTRDISKHLEILRARQIDGILLDAAGASMLDENALAGLTVVLIDEPSEHWPGIATDALHAGQLAAEHLLALGHRELAFVGPATDVHAFRMRERGFVSRLREAGVTWSSERWRRAPSTVAGGREAMRELLRLRVRPTGVFFANDLMAIGAIKQCQRDAVRLPDDCSIVGCDDIEFAQYVTPELTTISVPARELGARAARLLVQLIEQSAQRVSSRRPLPVRLMTRASSGPAPTRPTLPLPI